MNSQKIVFITVTIFVILSVSIYFFFNNALFLILPVKKSSVSNESVQLNTQEHLEILISSDLKTIDITQNPLVTKQILLNYKNVFEERHITKILVSFVNYQDYQTAFNLQISENNTSEIIQDDIIIGYDVNHPADADLIEIIIAINERHPLIINKQTNLSDLVSQRIFYGLSLFELNKQISSTVESESIGRSKYSEMFSRYKSHLVNVVYK